ncbi:glycoside hydrolase superfamily [Elsinoe ampelina]|uniref:mannan endo-1,4-beta-mannosidase n=1 Tax=Elsinoe ampelina TaxID=302913 RepID=A0A6A6FYQ1_9PEZI|nr:glycoside hydrolase superfamily [Elsinoe ampelina]
MCSWCQHFDNVSRSELTQYSRPILTVRSTTKPPASTTTKPPASSNTTKPPVSSTTKATSAAPSPTGGSGSSSFASASGSLFNIDGKKQYFVGTNSYWIGFLDNNDDIDLVFSHLQTAGIKVLRVWGFNDVTALPSGNTVYFQSFINGVASINTGTNGLQRLDYVVKSAAAHNVKLVINFVNNWTDYGGMAAYFSYAGITSNAQWYASAKAQAQYQAYIKAVVTRYADSPAVFAWELANEPRCNGCATSVLTNWIKTTSAYIKSLDSKHMVAIGDEGFGLTAGNDGTYPYTYAEGSDFEANCKISTIDYCTYHLYPESWSVSPGLEWGNAWVTSHGKACAAAGKPCVLEEFGYHNDAATEYSWQTTALNDVNTGGDMFWQLGDTLSWGQTHQDGNTIYVGDSNWQTVVVKHVADVVKKARS